MKKICYGLGLVVAMVLGWLQIQEIDDSRSWPAVQGTIVASGISKSSSYDSERPRSHTSGYEIRLRYSYVVNGMPYSGNRIAIRDTTYDSRSSAQRELQRYPVGKVVNVYYNPNDPEHSVLKPYLGNSP